MTESMLRGRLLVAAPTLVDPNFARTVVLMLDHDDTGSLGVVLNRPGEVPVEDVLPDWRSLVTEPPVLFDGGPVQTDGALGLVALNKHAPQEPAGVRRLVGSWGLVDLDGAPELLGDTVDYLRMFAGYAGWGAGQAEDEIAEGAWFVVPAELSDAFRIDVDDLWRVVLRRQPPPLAWISTFPDDPDHN